MKRNWRLRSVLREAGLNVANGGVRTLLMAVVLAALLTMGGLLEAHSVQQIVERDVDLARRGRFVLQITPGSNDRSPLDARACERLVGQDGVIASGSVLDNDLVPLRLPPGTTLRRITVTPGLYDVFDLTAGNGNGTARIFAGHEAADELELAQGAPIAFQTARHSELLTVGFVAETSVVRYPLADRAILVPAVGSETRVCYVEADPRIFNDYRSGGVASLDTLTEGTPTVTALAHVEKGETPSERYASRLSRFASYAAGIAAAAVFAVDLQTRRKEIGVYRATGTTRSATFLIFYADQILTLVAGCVIAAFATSTLVVTSGLGRQAALHGLGALSTAVPIAGIGLVPIVATAICRRDIISTLKQ